MKTRLSRRTLLRGVLGGAAVSIGLPPLEAFFNTNGTAYADDSAFPQRFGLIMWGNGVLPERWVPIGTGRDYELSEQLAPLERHRDVFSVLSGFEVKVPNTIPHFSGASGILTGRGVLERGDDRGSFPTQSLDQVIAAEIGNDTRFRSLEFGAEAGKGLSYNGPDSLNPPETDPASMFNRVFGGDFRAPGETTEPNPRLALRRSVLDAVTDDATRIQSRLGANDRARLEQHLDGIRDLERRIARLEEDPPSFEACVPPEAPVADFSPVEGRPQIREKNAIMAEIVAMAMACDQTRVFSNFLTAPVSNHLFEVAGEGHHVLTHNEPGEQPGVNQITIELMRYVATFLDALRAIPEGDGTLLDNAGLLITSDVSRGKLHSFDEFPILVAGRASGRLVPGQHLRSEAANASEVPLTMVRAMGINAASFGEDDGYTENSVGGIEG